MSRIEQRAALVAVGGCNARLHPAEEPLALSKAGGRGRMMHSLSRFRRPILARTDEVWPEANPMLADIFFVSSVA